MDKLKHAKHFVRALALVVAVSMVGCDSDGGDDDDQSGADMVRFVGTWDTVEAVTDQSGDQLAAFNAVFSSVLATFTSAGDATIAFDGVDSADDVTLDGTFTVDDATDTMTLVVPAGTSSVMLPLTYSFASDDRVSLTGNALALNLAFGTTFQGTATITVSK